MIAVCIPSRGLMHSDTVQDVIDNLLYAKQEFDLIISSGRPQPDAQNVLTAQALAISPLDYIWYVDDDMQLPTKLLQEMLDLDSDVVVAHYPCTAHGNDALHIRDGKFESAGMGCVLIKPKVLEKLKEPYFRADTVYVWETDHLQPYPAESGREYHGLHDVDFFQRLVKAGVTPAIAQTHAGQYNLIRPTIPKHGNHTNYAIETWRLPDEGGRRHGG